ncbi:MAG: N-acetylmuramoyl-L-alanine amidase [Elusimicrobia bacterium]|nr:N-acetylmuramoyl-L-alanine amidase [Elusimicrobiota bacterium]
MKKKKKAVVQAILIYVVFCGVLCFSAPLTGKKIFIDPGHGGSDPGAVGPTGLKESNVNLQTSLKLKDFLVNTGGAQTILSRESDIYPTLADRVNAANNWSADRFISVHYNASSDRNVNGTETLYYTYGSETSKDLAQKLQNRLVETLGLTNRGIKPRDDLYVLKNTKMPAALTESSFISNTYEEARLKNSDYIIKIGRAHYYGIADHFGVDPNPPAPPPEPSKPLSGKIFAIDPQSGGSSKGSIGPTGLYAKDVNLRVATVLKNNLADYGGATIIMTRSEDVSVTSTKRIEIINGSNADRLVSIAFPGSTNPDTNYTKTFYYENYSSKSSTSKDLAAKVQARLVEALNLTNKGVGKSSAAILVQTNMPGIITKPSHITNPYEEARLKDAAYTWKIGRYIYLGIADHYGVNP